MLNSIKSRINESLLRVTHILEIKIVNQTDELIKTKIHQFIDNKLNRKKKSSCY